MMRVAARPRKAMSKEKKSAVVPSTKVTARSAQTEIVGAPLAHHADRADWQQYGERRADVVVEGRLPDLVEIASALRRNDGFRPDSGPSRAILVEALSAQLRHPPLCPARSAQRVRRDKAALS